MVRARAKKKTRYVEIHPPACDLWSAGRDRVVVTGAWTLDSTHRTDVICFIYVGVQSVCGTLAFELETSYDLGKSLGHGCFSMNGLHPLDELLLCLDFRKRQNDL